MSDPCGRLHELLRLLPLQTFRFGQDGFPSDGLYVLFEEGERGHGTDRIVRIGTHRGDGRLPLRLEEHFLKENKDRSIFRKNIGRALLARDGDEFLGQWEIDLTSSKAKKRYGHTNDRERLECVERRVTEYIRRSFRFVVFPAPTVDERRLWESRLISTVSLCQECGPSERWLGLHSPKVKIRESGLWLEQQLYREPLSDPEMRRLSEIVQLQLGRHDAVG